MSGPLGVPAGFGLGDCSCALAQVLLTRVEVVLNLKGSFTWVTG